MGWAEWLGVAFGFLLYFLTLPFHLRRKKPASAANKGQDRSSLHNTAARNKNTAKPARWEIEAKAAATAADCDPAIADP